MHRPAAKKSEPKPRPKGGGIRAGPWLPDAQHEVSAPGEESIGSDDGRRKGSRAATTSIGDVHLDVFVTTNLSQISLLLPTVLSSAAGLELPGLGLRDRACRIGSAPGRSAAGRMAGRGRVACCPARRRRVAPSQAHSSLVLPGALWCSLVLSGALWCSLVLPGARCRRRPSTLRPGSSHSSGRQQ